MRKIFVKSCIIYVALTLPYCSSKKQTTEISESKTVETTVEKKDVKKERPIYNKTETRKSDILHTVLHVMFNWDKRQLYGKAIIDVKPYFYDTDSLILDAKAMDIHSVKLKNDSSIISYINDGDYLRIKLPKTYSSEEHYTVIIEYTANPEDIKKQGSSAISEAKGLYFINHDNSNPRKHQEIWTQGETEASSVWFPTIDNPVEKTTQEIYITVQNKFQTLSNGYLASSKYLDNNMRVDHWVMDKPHAPYLFMMAIGEYSIVQNKWIKKDSTELEVNYYVEKKYEPHAKAIFGETPNMLSYFSNLLGVEYPWVKYSQVVVRDFVSGAMENTTATIHGDFLYKTTRELIDGGNEAIIAHELFHHWFGNLVTCESWANLPLNESFANYSQYLWDEHKYGRMEADMNAFEEMEGYFLSAQQGGHVDMIRYDYKNKEDMFDGHSYNKGGRILHMLRTYVGDKAFFASLNDYLTTNAYKTVELANLRLSFEKITGEDLNWFFNQWFLASGHPIVKFEQKYIDSINELEITISQNQNIEKWPIYKLPINIDIYTSEGIEQKLVWVDKTVESFKFKNIINKPLLVNIDATKTLLAKKTDKKPLEQWIYQLNNSTLWLDKKEALDKLAKSENKDAINAIINTLDHPFWNVKTMAMSKLKKAVNINPSNIKSKLTTIAKTGKHPKERAAAIKYLSKYFEEDKELIPVYKYGTKDKSYNVVGNSIKALAKLDPDIGMKFAKENEGIEHAKLNIIVSEIYAQYGTQTEHNFFKENINELSSMNKYSFLQNYNTYLMRQDNKTIAKGIYIFKEVAENESMWFVKLAGYQLLYNLREYYKKEKNTITTSITSYEKNNELIKISEAEKEINFCKIKINEINKIIEKLKENETNSNVKKYLGI